MSPENFLGFQETVALNNFWLEAPDSSLSVTCLFDTLRHGYFPRTSATSLLVGANYGNLMAVYGMLVWKIQATRNTKSIYISLGAWGSPKVLWVGLCEWLKIVISLWRNVSFWRSHSLHRIVFCADEIFLIRVLIDEKSIIHTFIFVRNVCFVW